MLLHLPLHQLVKILTLPFPKVQDSSDEEEEDEEINMSDFQKTKQLQKLRKRTAGTNIVTLALGKKISKVTSS